MFTLDMRYSSTTVVTAVVSLLEYQVISCRYCHINVFYIRARGDNENIVFFRYLFVHTRIFGIVSFR